MAKFKPIKKPGMGLKNWKEAKTGKPPQKIVLLIAKKKINDTLQKRDKRKTGKEKELLKSERVFLLSRSSKF